MEYELGVQSADDDLDKRKRKSAIRRNAIKFTKIVSLVGLRHATDSRNSTIRRFVWLVWVVFGVLLAIYQIQDRVAYYLQYPSRTEVKFISDESSLLLPQVTICEDKTEQYSSGYTDKIKEELKKMKAAESQSKQQEKEDAIRALKENLEKLANETRNWDELSKLQSLKANETIAEVQSDSNPYTGLRHEIVTDMGHCFAFSTENYALSSTKGGVSHGLYVKLKAPQNPNSKGFKVIVHDPLVIPKVKENGIELRSGTVTRLTVTFENVTLLGPPYDSCKIDDPMYKMDKCLKLCEYEVFLTQCLCKDIHMPGNGPICSYADVLDCTEVFGSRANATSSNSSGACSCSPECNSRNYKTSITQDSFPQFGKDVYLYVYYQHLTYTQMENVADFTFLELLCEIGGALSLLLGATLLTVYEAIEFFVLFVRDYLRLRFAKRQLSS